MKLFKTLMALAAAAALVCTFAGMAGAQILNNASQIVNLAASGPDPIPFTSFGIRNPDGSVTANWTIPANNVLVITKVKYSFVLTSGNLAEAVILAVGPYYTKRFGFTGTTNTAADNDNLPTGLVIGVGGWTGANTIKVYYASDATKTPLTGTLTVNLVGFTAPNQ